MSASECPASSCLMRLWTLAAIISFAVCRGCGCLGFCVDGATVGMVAMLLMVCLSFAVAFAFHAMRGMYLHAERLLAKAGRQSARGGVSPIRSRAEDEQSEGLHKRSAEDCWETPCAAPGRRPQRGLVSL